MIEKYFALRTAVKFWCEWCFLVVELVYFVFIYQDSGHVSVCFLILRRCSDISRPDRARYSINFRTFPLLCVQSSSHVPGGDIFCIPRTRTSVISRFNICCQYVLSCLINCKCSVSLVELFFKRTSSSFPVWKLSRRTVFFIRCVHRYGVLHKNGRNNADNSFSCKIKLTSRFQSVRKE